MTNPKHTFIAKTIFKHYDTDDGNMKIIHIHGNIQFKTTEGKTRDILYVGLTTDNNINAFCSNEDDTEQEFYSITDLSESIKEQICYDIHPLINLISKRVRLHENLPIDFDGIPSVNQYKKEDDATTLKTYIGQVGLGYGDGGLGVNVYFPNRNQPTHNYCTPLWMLVDEELECICKSLEKEKAVMQRIVVFSQDSHEVVVIDVDSKILQGTYDGDVEKFFKENYCATDSKYTWCFAQDVYYHQYGKSPQKIDIEKLIK